MTEAMWLIALVHVSAMSSPGPTAFVVLRNSLSDGGRGYATSAGAATATLLHALIGVAGFGTLIMNQPMLAVLLKYSGAVYLSWLGVKILKGLVTSRDYRANLPRADQATEQTLGSSYREGFLTTALNPKVVVLYVALFSQFLGPDTPTRWSLVFTAQLVVQALIYWMLFSTVVAKTGFRALWERWNRLAEGTFGIALISFGVAMAASKI